MARYSALTLRTETQGKIGAQIMNSRAPMQYGQVWNLFLVISWISMDERKTEKMEKYVFPDYEEA